MEQPIHHQTIPITYYNRCIALHVRHENRSGVPLAVAARNFQFGFSIIFLFMWDFRWQLLFSLLFILTEVIGVSHDFDMEFQHQRKQNINQAYVRSNSFVCFDFDSLKFHSNDNFAMIILIEETTQIHVNFSFFFFVGQVNKCFGINWFVIDSN